MVSTEHLEKVLSYIEIGQQEGATLLTGGHRVTDGALAQGNFVAPTVFGDVDNSWRIAQEEIFGPVQVVLPFDDEADALRIANGTPFGLVAGVWTRDGSRALRMARKLHCGQVFINNYGAGGGIELPFGGVKHSGHGREKGFEALYGFSALKTVAIRHD
jgi:aldehyde dehydrogenase (NAD+)